MMKRTFKISIFMLLISIFACGFLSLNNKDLTVYAAEGNLANAYCLMGADGNTYLSNVEVGTVEGAGQFILGHENIVSSAIANENYQIVGWEITYNKQNDKIDFFDTKDLNNGLKTVELTAKDGNIIEADIEYTSLNGYMQKSKFYLDNAFEDLTIRPVFDHIYYQVVIDDVVSLSELSNHVAIGTSGDVLYYNETSTSDGVTTYTDAYIKIDNKYCYYGTVLKNVVNGEDKFYTTHKTQQDTPVAEAIDYSRGAFRFGEEVNMNYDINIDQTDIKNSINIDLQGVSVEGNQKISLMKEGEESEGAGFYNHAKDSFKRTKNYTINFPIENSANYTNIIDLNYHNLFVVDVQILVDGVENASELSDVLGELTVRDNEVVSNVTISNFYSITSETNLQFLTKASVDNNAKAFGVNCIENIGKTYDETLFNYYKFNTLNGVREKDKYFPNINTNILVEIDYSSVNYYVNFDCVEYVKDSSGQVNLSVLAGNTLGAQELQRGDKLMLTSSLVASVKNVGYKFVGFANSLTSEVYTNGEYIVDNAKPKSVTLLLCFEKIEYTVVLTNYNKLQIEGTYPIASVAFTMANGLNESVETLNATDLVGESVQLTSKIKLNSNVGIATQINNGFNVLGYSLVDPTNVTSDDYFTSFVLTQQFIQDNNLTETIILYVYEDYITYSLTYVIDEALDTKTNTNVIMAKIDVETTANVVKYDKAGVEISAANNNTNAMVAKIVVNGLQLNDVVMLTSEGLTIGEGEGAYTYTFSWFTEDGKSTLTHTQQGNIYKHEEKIVKSRTIKVVYLMPSTRVHILIDEDFAGIQQFEYSYTIVQSGNVLSPEADGGNAFLVEVGNSVTISISDLAYGYEFMGYQIVGTSEIVETASSTFDYSPVSGNNNIVLKFKRTVYHFIFAEYGAGKEGELIKFDSVYYASLNIDNTSLEITKAQVGYYVASVEFGDGGDEYSAELSENNNSKYNDNIAIYSFNLEREQFEDIVKRYGKTNAEGIAEINVRLDYMIYTYDITIQYGLTNPKGDSRDDYVVFPTLTLDYVYEGKDYSIKKPYVSRTVVYSGVPYGVEPTINVLSGAPSGVLVEGWFDGDTKLTQDQYAHSTTYLILGTIAQDLTFNYKFTYSTYYIKLVRDNSQGAPTVLVNNDIVDAYSDIEVQVYDKIEISANALRSKGYKFKSYYYSVPSYKVFVYDNALWNSNYASLFIKDGDDYILNKSNIYDANTTYYICEEATEYYTESDTLSIEALLISNYYLKGSEIKITIEYELLQLSIINEIKESGPTSPLWNLTNRGTGNAALKIAQEDLALFTIEAVGKDGVSRVIDTADDLTNNDTVTYEDVVTITVIINKNAYNPADEQYYDLSIGLILNGVQISAKKASFKELAISGEYEIKFNVAQYMPATGTDINISYKLQVTAKTIGVTTIIEDAPSFYENFKMFINAKDYGFASSTLESINGASEYSQSLQYLSKANVYGVLQNEYQTNFEVSGARIYCDGYEITPDEYAAYGISVTDDWTVVARLIYSINVVFKIQPILTLNGGPNYTKVFQCDNYGVARSQTLSVGAHSNFDIQAADIILPCIQIQYLSTEANSYPVASVEDCGNYNVLISFVDNPKYDWLSQIKITDSITLTIVQKEIYLTYDAESVSKVSKTYDGKSDWEFSKLNNQLRFTDGGSLSIKYSDIIATSNNNLTLQNGLAYITKTGAGDRVADANENLYYNVYLYNFSLKESSFNSNFRLMNTDLIVSNYVKINKREIVLLNINVYDKVYDGKDNASFSAENVQISNKIGEDNLVILPEKLIVKFKDSSIGANKVVSIDASAAIGGTAVGNYSVKNSEVGGLTIYPYRLTAKVNGVGEISLINKRGLTDKNMVSLIPLNATFTVDVIKAESVDYANIYQHISRHLKGNNEYSIGYTLSMMVGGEKVNIDKNLHLSVPNIKNLTGTFFLTGAQSGEVKYELANDKVIIDLKQINVDVNSLFLTQKKLLLKAWQIVLIVLSIVMVIAGVVLTLIIVRKRKHKEYSSHEKI